MQESHREITSAVPQTAPTIAEIVDYAIAEHEDDFLRGDWNPYDGYRTPLWSFTRALRSHFGENVEPDAVFWQYVQPEIERRGGWEILETGLDTEGIYFEFACNWDAVRYKIGETPLGNALEKAEAHPLQPRRASKRPVFLARYARFVSIAGWLQVSMGNRPIMLPVGRLSEMLGVKPMTVTRYRQTAEADGYLRVVKEHTYSKGLATEFRFDVSRFAALQEKAQLGTEESFIAGEHRV